MILLTGAGGMLGKYVAEQFCDEEIESLGLSEGNTYKTDLSKEVPQFGNKKFSTVVHAAGTEDNLNSMALNYEGTRRLVQALDQNPPHEFVYISSYQVYSRDAGENISEETNTWATSEAGKSKALAEALLKDWAEKNNVTLTIIRPARMFGNGVHGDTLHLFNDALSGKYIHIRGNDAKVSVVCALDVARGVRNVYKFGGIYNAADGRDVKFIDLVESLTANAGAKKRMTHLPANWAEWLWRLGKWVPSINRNLSPEIVETRMKTITLDGTKLAATAGIEYFNTLEVIERIDKSYPYSHSYSKPKHPIHEV